MAAMALRHFDVLGYVEKSRALGVDEKVATYQARQIEEAIDIAVITAKTEIENKELATKGDIRALDSKLEKELKALDLKIEQTKAEIYKSKFDVIIWVVGLVAGLFVASGLIQHFFK